MLTNGWVEFLAPSLRALIVGTTGEKLGNFMPLASKLLHGLDELNVLRVRPATWWCRLEMSHDANVIARTDLCEGLDRENGSNAFCRTCSSFRECFAR